jgi:2'-5' RNA ligase
MSHRLFAALPVPDAVAERLLPLRTDLFGARWRQRDHFHITLHFYGSVEIEMAEEIAQALEQVSQPMMQLQVDGVGWFGRKEPHLIHARIASDPALDELAEDCRRIARRLGLKTEARAFRPHITLAYCHHTPLVDVMTWSETYQTLKTSPFMADEFHLYESFTGSRRQSRYQVQASYRLG